MITSPSFAENLAQHNPYQSNAPRVLCVCSVGMLRSPTLANELHKNYGYNTRSCGVLDTHALVPISSALIRWADEIVFMDFSSYEDLKSSEDAVDELERAKAFGTVVYILSIPDSYNWNDKELRDISVLQYLEKRKYSDME